MGLAGVGFSSGPSHWKSGVIVTPVTEQVSLTVSPAMIELAEEVREMPTGRYQI